jgi:uncharacterized membrane protein YdbT with pleckstrin-like domain
MRYIDKILQSGESVLHTSKIHWIVYLPAVLVLMFAAIALTQSTDNSAGALWLSVCIAAALAGGVLLFRAWFRRWTTEIDVTNLRIVYKRGFIRRHTVEMNMDKVESVDVDQSIFGRLLNYGDITIHGTGIGLEPLHNIEAPLEFRNFVTAR